MGRRWWGGGVGAREASPPHPCAETLLAAHSSFFKSCRSDIELFTSP